MAILLALDVGERRTGVAMTDTTAGFIVALPTLQHEDKSERLQKILSLARERRAGSVILGLPLLPQGEEGEQARDIRGLEKDLQTAGLSVKLIDERYTTLPQNLTGDSDAASACKLLEIVLDQREFQREKKY